MSIKVGCLLARARPSRVIAVAALVVSVIPPLVVLALLNFYGARIGEMTVIIGGRSNALNWRWIFPLSSIVSMLTYLALTACALLGLRNASRFVRNSVVVALVPVSLAAVYFTVGRP